MTIEEQRQIFSKNLSYLIAQSGKQQKEIAKDLGIPYTTFHTWVRGTSMPNAAKIQTLADYFGVFKSDLLDSKIEYEDITFESHANISLAKRYLAYVVGLEASDIVSSLAQLNKDGLAELQKRLDEMLCVPRYRKESKPDRHVYMSFDENGLQRFDSLGREIKE